LVWEDIPIGMRKRLWNKINKNVFESIHHSILSEDFKRDVPPGMEWHFKEDEYIIFFLNKLWDNFYKYDFDDLWYPSADPFGYGGKEKCIEVDKIKAKIKDWFFEVEWFEAFDFIDFLNKNYPGEDILIELNIALNEVLEEENSAYRIIDGIVTPLIDKEQIKEIEKAMNPPDKFAPVREHMRKALKCFSDKKESDYEGTIREAIHAVESLAKIITGKEKSLSALIQSLTKTHYNLREGFKELYNFASIVGRHGKSEIERKKSGKKIATGGPEARYMLVTCSAFVNYVIAKYGDG